MFLAQKWDFWIDHSRSILLDTFHLLLDTFINVSKWFYF